MWQYEKKLQYPVNIKNPNPKLAKVIITQLGGANRKKIRYLWLLSLPAFHLSPFRFLYYNFLSNLL